MLILTRGFQENAPEAPTRSGPARGGAGAGGRRPAVGGGTGTERAPLC